MAVRSPAYKLRCTSKGLVYYTVFLTLTGMTCSWSRVTKPSRHPERSRRRSEGSGPQLRHVILNEVKDLG